MEDLIGKCVASFFKNYLYIALVPGVNFVGIEFIG
jgi:hypothetical protein